MALGLRASSLSLGCRYELGKSRVCRDTLGHYCYANKYTGSDKIGYLSLTASCDPAHSRLPDFTRPVPKPLDDDIIAAMHDAIYSPLKK